MSTKYPNICGSDKINQAIEDIHNGNRLMMSRAALQCRIAEVMGERAKEREDFEAWKRKTLVVRG